MSLLTIALLLAAPMQADGAMILVAAPPLPPSFACGRYPRYKSVELALSGQSRLDEVVAAWGEPGRAGPAGEMASYNLDCGARLWRSFDAGEQRWLQRAILLSDSPNPRTHAIIEGLQQSLRRHCRELPTEGPVDPGLIVARWGPPDNEVGSGIVRYSYLMADGGHGQAFPTAEGVRVTCAMGGRD